MQKRWETMTIAVPVPLHDLVGRGTLLSNFSSNRRNLDRPPARSSAPGSP